MGFTKDIPMVELVAQQFLEEKRASVRRQNQLTKECYSSQSDSQGERAIGLGARRVPDLTRYPTLDNSEDQTATDHEGTERGRITEIQPAQAEQAHPTAAAERSESDIIIQSLERERQQDLE